MLRAIRQEMPLFTLIMAHSMSLCVNTSLANKTLFGNSEFFNTNMFLLGQYCMRFAT